MKKVWMLLLLILFALPGCDMAVDMGEMMRKMETINGALKAELDLDAQVGWNIQNGTITQVSVIIPGEQVSTRSVQELKELTYPVIRKHFEQDPLLFQVVVAFSGKDLGVPDQ